MTRDTDELLTFIFEHIGHIATLDSNEAILQALATMGRDIVFADRCTIWVYDKKKEILWTKVADGIGYISIDAQSGIVGSTLKDGEAVVINDVYKDERFNSTVDQETGYKTETMMVIPMKNRNHEVIGAIQVINKKNKESFSSSDMKHLKLASTYVGETIKTTLLLEEIDETQRELIHILGLIADSRSKETANHLIRVANYSYLLAGLYGLGKKQCVLVRDVAPLHDIGKLAISDTILHKAGQLNDVERKNMMMHPELGYNMLRHSERELIKMGAVVAHEHHEKYDGSGYPRGIKGEEIHIFGRIVTLADVFDALCSKRSYKKSWDIEQVLEYVKEEKGKHFDPVLADYLIDNIDKFLEIQEAYSDGAIDE